MEGKISNEENKGLILGLDIKEYSLMASVYDYDNDNVFCLEFDNRQELLFNKSLADMLEISNELSKKRYEEFTAILSRVINEAATKIGSVEIDSICVVLRNYKIDYLEGIKRALVNLSIEEKKIEIISCAESFAYYAYSQKRELYISGVCLIDFEDNGLNFIRLNSKRTNNVDYIIENSKNYRSEDLENVLSKNKTLDDIDEYLSSCFNDFLEKSLISAVYITGKGFNVDKLPAGFTKLIVNRHKAFIGQNLYTKGAAYAALENIRPKVFDNTVLLSDQRIMVGIELDILDEGKPKRFRLVKPGTNWFMADRRVDFIIEDLRQIKLNIVTANNQFEDEYIDISEFPYREAKTTRISLSVKFFSTDRAQIVVKDLGFGDFFKSSGKVVYKDLDFAI